MAHDTFIIPPLTILRQVFKYAHFRPGQAEIIDAILAGKDTLALLPTGGGKSLCFQVPGICLGGTTLVVSPLLSLMQDQLEHLQAKNISATTINSTLSAEEKQRRLDHIASGKCQFVYSSPESLQNPRLLEACQAINIRLVVIDEAHCISEWGHDFRPEYLHIAGFVAKLARRPVVAAFTATATATTRDLICSSLKLQKPTVFCESFLRSNLKISLKICPDRFTQELLLGRILEKHAGQRGIIYTSTRESTEYLATYLGQFYPHIAAYHGGLTSQVRSQVQHKFQAKELKVIVATNAFGMGVDQSDIRFVIHYHLPSSLEAYYQEIGRAGRDGQLAETYGLFYSRYLAISSSFLPAPDDLQYPIKFSKLQQMIRFSTHHGCRYQFLLEYFGEKVDSGCGLCDNCVPVTWSRGVLEDTRYRKFLTIRDAVAYKYQVKPQQLLTNQLTKLLALYQPQSREELAKIPGIGWGWLAHWYPDIEPYLRSHT